MRARFLYAACTDAHLDATYVYTYVRKYVCVLCMLFLSGTPHGLSSRSTGQWLAASTALFRSTPLRTAPLFPSSLARPPPPLISTRCPPLRLLSYVLYNASPHLVRLFFPSFVRVTLAREQPGVSETSMRDSSSFLVSSLRPYPFPFALPFPPPLASGHPRAPLFSAAPSLPRSNPTRFHG